jgi:hypothetical protein
MRVRIAVATCVAAALLVGAAVMPQLGFVMTVLPPSARDIMQWDAQEQSSPCVRQILQQAKQPIRGGFANSVFSPQRPAPISKDLASLREFQPDATELDVVIYRNQEALDEVASALEQGRTPDEWYKIPGFADVAEDQLGNNCHGMLHVRWKGPLPRFAVQVIARAERRNPGSIQVQLARYSLHEEENCVNALERGTGWNSVLVGRQRVYVSSLGPSIGSGVEVGYYAKNKAGLAVTKAVPDPKDVAGALSKWCPGLTVTAYPEGPAVPTIAFTTPLAKVKPRTLPQVLAR